MMMMWKSQPLCTRTPRRHRIFRKGDSTMWVDDDFYAHANKDGRTEERAGLCVSIPLQQRILRRDRNPPPRPVFTLWRQMNYIRLGLRSPPNEIIKFVNTFWVENWCDLSCAIMGYRNVQEYFLLLLGSILRGTLCECELNCIYHNGPIPDEVRLFRVKKGRFAVEDCNGTLP